LFNNIKCISFNNGTDKQYRTGGHLLPTSLLPVTIGWACWVQLRFTSPHKCAVRLYIYRKADSIPNLIYHVDWFVWKWTMSLDPSSHNPVPHLTIDGDGGGATTWNITVFLKNLNKWPSKRKEELPSFPPLHATVS